MEMDQQERESELGEESPVSHNDEDMSDGEGGRSPPTDNDELDDCNDLRRHAGLLAEHGDVLAKLKMQVRDIKVGDDFDSSRTLSFAPPGRANGLPAGAAGHRLPDGFAPLPVPFPFPHPAAAFLPPLAPHPPPPPASSGSSHSSDGSTTSSQHTWSFEEQFKQVRQLYEINDDPKRKEFLDDLFSFMQKRGTPINRLPIMAKSVLDLYELYNLVIARGGLVDVINKKLWQEIIKGLHLPSSITSAAFTLRTQYMKYLYPYECEKRRLSTPAELQAAIDGNRREGRRSSYGQYDAMHGQHHHAHHQQQQQQRSPTNHHLQMTLVAQQQQQLAARMLGGGMGVQALHNGGAHHPSHPQPLGQPMNGGPMPGLAPSEFETRMMEYVKLLNKEIRSNATPPRDVSPPQNAVSPLDQLEMSRMTLWNLYNNNQPPPEPQKEPINLSEPAGAGGYPASCRLHVPAANNNNNLSGGGQIKREPEARESPPPAKRVPKDDDEEDEEEEEEEEQRRAVKSMSPSTNIKINTRGDSRNGDNSLVVSMELNGITYQGVLFAQNAPSSGRTAMAS